VFFDVEADLPAGDLPVAVGGAVEPEPTSNTTR
jgi:hypothetical protein